MHVDPPTEHKAYLHRSGRTARAGAGGVVVTLATPEQHRDVRGLAKAAGIAPQVRTVRPGDAAILELAGPAAPLVDFVPPQAEPQQQRQRPARRPERDGQRPARGPKAGGGQKAARPQKQARGHAVSSPEAREATRTAASGTPSTASTAPRKGPRRASSPQAPARTRAELAARMGQQQPATRRGR